MLCFLETQRLHGETIATDCGGSLERLALGGG